MQLAQTNEGKKVTATVDAPKEAICPHCGGILTLRSRKTMNSCESTYFWRHCSNQNRHCSARHRPVA